MPRPSTGHPGLVTRVCAIVGIAVALAAFPAAQLDRQPTIPQLLDLYDLGEFALAVRTAVALPNLASWRHAYPAAAREWIDRSPPDARRRLVAASLALEVAREYHERSALSWPFLRDVVEWACRELARESQPSPGEQAWQRASVALGQRVKDPSWLALGPSTGNHLEHAWQRFPHDPRFALASIVIGTRGADTDIARREKLLAAKKQPTIVPNPALFGGATGIAPAGASSVLSMPHSDAVDPRRESHQAIEAFGRLLSNPEIGAEAEIHVSHVYLMLYDWQAALEHALAAAKLAPDGRSRYLGSLMAGLAQEQLGRRDDARAAYQQAIEALPNGQTAALLLAALGNTVETPGQSAALVKRSLAASPLQDDPWRLYYYGDYFYWPVYIEQLHKALR